MFFTVYYGFLRDRGRPVVLSVDICKAIGRVSPVGIYIDVAYLRAVVIDPHVAEKIAVHIFAAVICIGLFKGSYVYKGSLAYFYNAVSAPFVAVLNFGRNKNVECLVKKVCFFGC